MNKIIPLLLIFSLNIFSQKSIVKTIYANASNKVLLVFNSPIKQAIEGSQEYVFGYNTKKPTKIGSLIAMRGASPTNLFIVTTDDKMYSFLLEYKEKINKNELVHIIKPTKSIKPYRDNTITNIKKDSITNESKSISNEDYDLYYKENTNSSNKHLKISKDILLMDKSYFRRQLKEVDNVFF